MKYDPRDYGKIIRAFQRQYPPIPLEERELTDVEFCKGGRESDARDFLRRLEDRYLISVSKDIERVGVYHFGDVDWHTDNIMPDNYITYIWVFRGSGIFKETKNKYVKRYKKLPLITRKPHPFNERVEHGYSYTKYTQALIFGLPDLPF